MNAAAETRQSELDRALDASQATIEVAEELFAVTDLLETEPSLRRALTDPSAPDAARRALASSVLTGRVSDAAAAVATAAAGLRWGGPTGLVAALDRQGVRALITVAQQASMLDTVEEELFRFSRIVEANPALRASLADRSTPLAARQELVADLLRGRAHPITISMATRAVAARQRTFDLTAQSFLGLAAQARRRAIATVTVAKPLPADQRERLRAALVRQLGREVNLHVVVDPDVLGGVRVSVGNEVIEGTVAGRLASAERQLS